MLSDGYASLDQNIRKSLRNIKVQASILQYSNGDNNHKQFYLYLWINVLTKSFI